MSTIDRTPQKASLAQSIDIEKLVQQFLSFGTGFQFPDFLPGTLEVTELGIDATLHSGKDAKNSYTLDGGLHWRFDLGDAFSVDVSNGKAMGIGGHQRECSTGIAQEHSL